MILSKKKKRKKDIGIIWVHTGAVISTLAMTEPHSLPSFSYWSLFAFFPPPSVCNKGSCQPIRPLLKYGWRDERDEGLEFLSQLDPLHPHLLLLISVMLTSLCQFREWWVCCLSSIQRETFTKHIRTRNRLVHFITLCSFLLTVCLIHDTLFFVFYEVAVLRLVSWFWSVWSILNWTEHWLQVRSENKTDH